MVYPGRGQWPSRGTARAVRYLPGKEYCYLRTQGYVYTYSHPSPSLPPWGQPGRIPFPGEPRETRAGTGGGGCTPRGAPGKAARHLWAPWRLRVYLPQGPCPGPPLGHSGSSSPGPAGKAHTAGTREGLARAGLGVGLGVGSRPYGEPGLGYGEFNSIAVRCPRGFTHNTVQYRYPLPGGPCPPLVSLPGLPYPAGDTVSGLRPGGQLVRYGPG